MAKRQTITKPALQNLPSGMDLLDRPLQNKSTAFTEEERKKFGLHGLLPPQVESLDEQVVRAYEAYRRKDDDLERHIYLRALRSDANSSAISTGGRAACSSLTRCVILSLSSCEIVQIQMSTSLL